MFSTVMYTHMVMKHNATQNQSIADIQYKITKTWKRCAQKIVTDKPISVKHIAITAFQYDHYGSQLAWSTKFEGCAGIITSCSSFGNELPFSVNVNNEN